MRSSYFKDSEGYVDSFMNIKHAQLYIPHALQDSFIAMHNKL